MSTAPVRDRASAFRSPPVSFAPLAWSGRVDPGECGRPGGLLIAALMQCATERDLSLSELASELGVSFWSLSQLRIGFRPIDELDDDLADACAAFLDLPRLTIEMLAGLVEPQVLLETEAVSGEDILCARQLLVTEPADLCLAPPANRARPLQGLTVDDLAELHRAYGGNAALIEVLRAELGHRPMSKTEQLRAALGAIAVVSPAAEAAKPEPVAPGPVVLRCLHCSKRLRVPHLEAPGEIVCPSCQTEYAVHWQGEVCLVQRMEAPPEEEAADEDTEHASDSPADDPWTVLGLAPGSAWEAVERARRSLLQQYHPDRLGHVSPLVHKLAEDAFKRVGDAYETLKAAR